MALELSVVIPCYNEEGNLCALFDSLHTALAALGLSYEIIVTDDASQDGSWKILTEFAAADPRIKAQRLAANAGESAASWAGIQAACGNYIVTLDADLQNDPHDLPEFIEALRHFDCVSGSRVATRRKADGFVRAASSQIANRLRNLISGEKILDSGCTYRAFKRESVARLKFFNGMHRFLPTLIRLEGFSVTQIPISNHPRFAGRSHYGVWNRLFTSFHDLLAVRWMKRRMFHFLIAETLN